MIAATFCKLLVLGVTGTLLLIMIDDWFDDGGFQ